MDVTIDTHSESSAPAAAAASGVAGPRLVFFEVPDRRDLAQRAAAAAPRVRFASRRSWTEDPGEPRRPLLGGDAPAGLWYWKDTAEAFEAQATEILLRLVHPLIARGLPCCLGFPFGAEVLEPHSLAVGESPRLDLEDIGRLLRNAGAPESSTTAKPKSPPATAAAPQRRPTGGPDAVRLDDAQRAAVVHASGPARVLAPAGSGKTKTLVSRVVELVDRGADPSGILMLAFNRKAAEQLEERLAALGIGSTRRLGSPADARGRRPVVAAPPDPPAAHRPARPPAPRRGPLRHVQRLRLPLSARGAAGARHARPRRPLASRPHGARHGDGRTLSLRDLKPRRGSDPVGAFMIGLTRVRAALEPPAGVEVQIESLGETPRSAAVRACPRPVHPRAGGDWPAVVRRSDLLRGRSTCWWTLDTGPSSSRASSTCWWTSSRT